MFHSVGHPSQIVLCKWTLYHVKMMWHFEEILYCKVGSLPNVSASPLLKYTEFPVPFIWLNWIHLMWLLFENQAGCFIESRMKLLHRRREKPVILPVILHCGSVGPLWKSSIVGIMQPWIKRGSQFKGNEWLTQNHYHINTWSSRKICPSLTKKSRLTSVTRAGIDHERGKIVSLIPTHTHTHTFHLNGYRFPFCRISKILQYIHDDKACLSIDY